MKTLNELINSESYQIYESETLLNPQHHIINNTGIDVDYMIEAQSNGCFGVSHGGFIECWREYLETLDINETAKQQITKEINTCEAWHIKNQTINATI